MRLSFIILRTQKLIEHKISDEDIEIQLYKGAGFIHVLFTKPTKQLYGIMFSDVAEGKKFYFRMINKIGKLS